MIPFFRQCIIIIQCGLIITFSAKAEVITDGSLGRRTVLPGPDYQIGADLGQQYGGNLFHSFQDFNLQASESATFSGANSVQNIISRVTGGNPSNIDGLIRSEIPDADMYFLNPYGIMFGPNAKLNVQGSFYASTADYLRLRDGGNFNARNPSESILSVAPIEEFGFLTESPASLSIDGSELSVAIEKTLFFSGGNINIINQAKLTALFGRIRLVSVQGIYINQAEFTAEVGRIFFRSVQGIDINQAEFAASFGRIVFASLTGQAIKINQTELTTPFGGIFFVNLTDPYYYYNNFVNNFVNLIVYQDNIINRKIPFGSTFFVDDLIDRNLTDQGINANQLKLTDLPSEIYFASLTNITSFKIMWSDPPENPINNRLNDIFNVINSLNEGEKIKLAGDALSSTPIFFSVDKLLMNKCAGLTKETLSSFFIDKGPKTRPSAPDDLKTHAIQITDVLPLTAYQTNTSQIGVSFDKKRQPLPLQIGCVGK